MSSFFKSKVPLEQTVTGWRAATQTWTSNENLLKLKCLLNDPSPSGALSESYCRSAADNKHAPVLTAWSVCCTLQKFKKKQTALVVGLVQSPVEWLLPKFPILLFQLVVIQKWHFLSQCCQTLVSCWSYLPMWRCSGVPSPALLHQYHTHAPLPSSSQCSHSVVGWSPFFPLSSLWHPRWEPNLVATATSLLVLLVFVLLLLLPLSPFVTFPLSLCLLVDQDRLKTCFIISSF